MSRRTTLPDWTVYRYSGFATEIHLPSWRSREPPKDRGNLWSNIRSQTIQINSWPYQKGLFLNNLVHKTFLSGYETRYLWWSYSAIHQVAGRNARLRSYGKAMFSQTSVNLFTEGWGPYPYRPGTTCPLRTTKAGGTHLIVMLSGQEWNGSAVGFVNSTVNWNTVKRKWKWPFIKAKLVKSVFSLVQ